MLKDYYEILGVTPKASSEEIREAFKKLAKAFHPDKHQGDAFFSEKFKSLQEAYNILSNADKRKDYDTQLAAQLSGQGSAKKQSETQNTPQNNTQTSSQAGAQSQAVVDLPTLVDMYFQKRVATVQARKFYDGFLATKKERHITWLKATLALLISATGVALWLLTAKGYL